MSRSHDIVGAPLVGPSLGSWAIGAGLSAFGAAPTGQRLDPLDLFARLLIKGGVAEVDVPVQARVRVLLLFGGWVRVGCARLSSVHRFLTFLWAGARERP